MKIKDSVYVAFIGFLIFSLFSLIWVLPVVSSEYLEEFDNKDLDPNLWEMKVENGATYVIDNGQLTMTSPAVADGILLYWRGCDVTDQDFTVEIKAHVAQDTNNAAVIAFIKDDLPPTVNTTINPEWKTMFWCGTDNSGWYINDDSWQRTNAKGPEFEGVWKAEIKGDKIHCYFNDEEVTVVDKVKEPRFLCFGPDTYTSHYSGEMTIDWIKLSGPLVPAAAIDSRDKLPTVWCRLRSE